jgi:hypothetical protein
MPYIPVDVENRVRGVARHRCGYCLSQQRFVMGKLEIEHIIPTSRGGTDDEINLWLACSVCNGHKSNKIEVTDPDTGESVRLFNPRIQNWFEHFRWSEDGIYVIGLTPVERATVDALHLNTDPDAITVRRAWVEVGWHPPLD